MEALSINDLRSLSLVERASMIDAYSKSIIVPSQIKPSLQTAYQRATTIKPLLLDYCQRQVESDRQGKSVLDPQHQAVLSGQ